MVFYLPARIHLLIKTITAEPDAINKSPGQWQNTMKAFIVGTLIEIIGETITGWLVYDTTSGLFFEVSQED